MAIMDDWVTRRELDDAITAVREDIAETEARLRTEFTSTVRYEVGKVDLHLAQQDESLKWIFRTLVGGLITLIVLLILYLATHPTH